MSVDMKDVVGVQLGKVGCQSFHCLAMSVDCLENRNIIMSTNVRFAAKDLHNIVES